MFIFSVLKGTEKENKYSIKTYIFFFKLKITLPNGAIVQYMYKVGRDWLYHIYVTPSIFDEDNVEGLCGNPNGKADDFIPQGSSFPTSNMVRFQKSWR